MAQKFISLHNVIDGILDSDGINLGQLNAGVAGPQYATDYFVSADIGNDANTGLSSRTALATLHAALDAGEAGGVSFAVHILDDNEYEVTAAPGTRTTSVLFKVHAPVATIKGAVGGTTWNHPTEMNIEAWQVDGAELVFSSTGSGRKNFRFFNILNPNYLFVPSGGAASKGSTDVQATFIQGTGGIADFSSSGSALFRLRVSTVGTSTSNAARLYDIKVSGATNAISIECFNYDSKNNGVGDFVAILAENDGKAWYNLSCIGSSLAGVIECNGATTDAYGRASDASGGSLPILGTNPERVHDYSWGEGMNFSKLNTGALDAADLLNVRDVSGGEQIQTTIADIGTAIGLSDYVTLATDQDITGQKTMIRGAASGATASIIADSFILDGNGSFVGMSILLDDGKRGSIYFGTPTSNSAAKIEFHDSLTPSLRYLLLGVNGSTIATFTDGTINSSGQIDINNNRNEWHLRMKANATQTQPMMQLRNSAAGISWNWYLDSIRGVDRDTKLQAGTLFDVTLARTNGVTSLRVDGATGNIEITESIGVGVVPDAVAVLDLTSTTKGAVLPRMTATQASAITAIDGLILYTTDTDGTFTSIGYWAYEGGSWTKLTATSSIKTTAKVANYTAVANDFVLMTTGATDKTITLPAAASSLDVTIIIKKVDSGAGNVIIDGNGAETIDGQITNTILGQYTTRTLQCDGTEWWIK